MGSIIIGLEAVCGRSCNFQYLKTPEEFPHFRYFVDESGEITRSLQMSVIVSLPIFAVFNGGFKQVTAQTGDSEYVISIIHIVYI